MTLSGSLFGIAVALCAATSHVALGQAKADSGSHASSSAVRPHRRIVGVFDVESMLPIEGAEVVDIFTNASARTPANGLVELSAFQSRHDSAAIRVRKIGLSDTALVVMVSSSDTVPVAIYLSKTAATLPGMITEAMATDHHFARGMADFVDLANDKSQHSTVFSPADLRKADGRQLESVLFDKGIGVLRNCPASRLQLYIDGIKQTQIGIPKGMTSDQFEAAIFYGGSPPLAYNMTGGRGCATLLLWTRRSVTP